jgi:hypothetical protein
MGVYYREVCPYILPSVLYFVQSGRISWASAGGVIRSLSAGSLDQLDTGHSARHDGVGAGG